MFDFLNDKALAVWEDMKPTVVKYNGETVKSLSAYLKNAEGNPLQYKSEYKQNLFNLQIAGNTEQQTYSGTNLFNIDLFKAGESKGYTIDEDGIITFKENEADVRYGVDMTFKAGTYTLSCVGTTACLVGGQLFDDGVAYGWLGSGTPSKSFTFTTEKTRTIYIVKTTGATAGTIRNIQINKGTTVQPYEPYVGGIPSPNPDYPQPIHNANDSGMSLELKGKNLALATQVYPKATEITIDGRECIKNAGNKGFAFRLAGGFKENTQYTISFDVSVKRNANASQGLAPMVLFIKYKDTSTDWARDSVQSRDENFTHKVKTTLANRTIDYIGAYANTDSYDVYIDINTFMLQEGAVADPVYEPYFTPTTIAIPPSVTVGETNVPLRFSIYDKIIVDRLNGKVTYSSGTWYKEFNGNEIFYQSTFAENNGYGRCYIFSFDISATGGYCSHFKRSGWLGSKTVKNVFSWVGVNSTYNRIAFKTDGNKDDTFANSLVEFKALLKSLYDTGTPVTVLAKLNTPDETVLYDKAKNITTDLGQALMDFANSTQNATNIITITSTPSVSKLSVNYAKWGGALDDEV